VVVTVAPSLTKELLQPDELELPLALLEDPSPHASGDKQIKIAKSFRMVLLPFGGCCS
jgi:hypothetical protein